MARLGIIQERLAKEVGINQSLLSRILSGLRPTPPGFEVKVAAALDRLEAAEKAAQEAREKVLSGEGRR